MRSMWGSKLGAAKKLEVARLARAEAEQYKLAQLERATGDAEYKRRVMEADGALAQKLATYEQVNHYYANAIAQYTGDWVPKVVMGSEGGSIDGARALIDLLMVKTAKDLAIEPTPEQ